MSCSFFYIDRFFIFSTADMSCWSLHWMVHVVAVQCQLRIRHQAKIQAITIVQRGIEWRRWEMQDADGVVQSRNFELQLYKRRSRRYMEYWLSIFLVYL